MATSSDGRYRREIAGTAIFRTRIERDSNFNAGFVPIEFISADDAIDREGADISREWSASRGGKKDFSSTRV